MLKFSFVNSAVFERVDLYIRVIMPNGEYRLWFPTRQRARMAEALINENPQDDLITARNVLNYLVSIGIFPTNIEGCN